MNELGKEVIRWLLGGGAVALATFLGTTAYQQGQLEIERERYLREFLGRYVDLATKGTLDERIRFVQYWESLDVADQIGVDLTAYKKALAAEFNEAETYAAVMQANEREAPRPPGGVRDSAPPERPGGEERPPGAEPEPEDRAPVVLESVPQQQAYFTSRSQTIAQILPGAKDAPTLERQGFEALLANDIPAARDAFAAAEKAWSEYHNVAEIHRLLTEVSAQLRPGSRSLPPAELHEVMRLILRDFSWGMPPAIRTQMEAEVRSPERR